MKLGPKVTLYSRQGHDLTRRFPTIAAAVAKLPAKVVTIDGELVQAGERGIDFYALVGRQTRNVTLMAFDILQLDGKDLRGLPLEERLAQLEMMLSLSKVPGVALVPASAVTIEIPRSDGPLACDAVVERWAHSH